MPSNLSSRRRCVILAEGQNWHCAYCGIIVIDDVPEHTDAAMTIDHIIPLSEKGERGLDNEVCACVLCNNNRGDLNAEAFYGMVQKHGRYGVTEPARRARVRKDRLRGDERPHSMRSTHVLKPPNLGPNEVQLRLIREGKIRFTLGDYFPEERRG